MGAPIDGIVHSTLRVAATRTIAVLAALLGALFLAPSLAFADATLTIDADSGGARVGWRGSAAEHDTVMSLYTPASQRYSVSSGAANITIVDNTGGALSVTGDGSPIVA